MTALAPIVGNPITNHANCPPLGEDQSGNHLKNVAGLNHDGVRAPHDSLVDVISHKGEVRGTPDSCVSDGGGGEEAGEPPDNGGSTVDGGTSDGGDDGEVGEPPGNGGNTDGSGTDDGGGGEEVGEPPGDGDSTGGNRTDHGPLAVTAGKDPPRCFCSPLPLFPTPATHAGA